MEDKKNKNTFYDFVTECGNCGFEVCRCNYKYSITDDEKVIDNETGEELQTWINTFRELFDFLLRDYNGPFDREQFGSIAARLKGEHEPNEFYMKLYDEISELRESSKL